MKRLTIAAFGALLTALVASGFGCELIANVDRTKIDTGGGGQGGTPTGGGGQGGTPTGGGGQGGTGGAPQCTTPADCDPPAGECFEATCDGNVCGEAPKAVGTPVAMQTAGDCKVAQCDGAGAVLDANDDADLPDDDNECTDDVCTAGEPSNPAVAADSPCGANGMLVCDGLGQCVGCLEAADCGADTECQTHSCDAGTCNVANVMQGTPVAMQTGGDCKVEQCDGMGGTETADDNADVPADGTVCTDDVCASGMPSNPPVGADTVCAEGTGTLCDGNGACVECNAATDCPGADDECKTRSCDAGVCGFTFATAGTALASQTAGDCQQVVCDGAGNVTTANDDLDSPNDNNTCTTDTCVAGAPTFTNVMAGTTCGAAGVCDANGQCVGCNAPADCPGTDDECKTRTCNSNVCGFAFTAANTPVATQTTGDCKQNVCDGSGNVISQNTNDPPPDDGNQCTSQACSNGTPVFPAVPVDTACNQGGGSFCSAAGQCVACTQAAQCPAGNECKTATCSANTCGFSFVPNGSLTPTQTTGDCQVNQCDGAGNVVQAVSNGDAPNDNNDCTGNVCTNGVPSNPALAINTACGPGGASFCNGAGACVACNAAAQCPGSDTECQTRTCNANMCGFNFTASGTPVAAQTAGDCKQNQCNGTGGITSANFDTDKPVDGLECTGDVCTNGVPSNPLAAVNTACGPGGASFCSAGGQCVQCNAASQCPGSDTECQTRTCNSNMCGFNFTASGTPVAAQTVGDCKQNQCNGSGGVASVNLDADVPVDGQECTGDVCTLGVPSNPPAAVNTPCTQGGGTVCDGSGACVTPGCGDGVKNGTETDVDCGGSCADCVDGKVCLIAGDCVSGVCTGNVCQAATCSDGVKNGTESDVDCGGSCPACANGKVCGGNGDCSSAICNGGTCVECAVAAQCPGSDTECQTRTCNSNVCGFSFTAAGTPVASQTAGDCKQNQCNGTGGITIANLDADVPVDGLECTGDVCTLGVPSNPPVAVDTACGPGGASFCSAGGQCVQCTAAAQCPAGDECKTATCSSNTCGFSFTAAGFVTSSQMPGDCKQNQCDGAGNSAPVTFDTDVPVDGNQCTDDVCTAGAPSNPALPLNTMCSQNGGTICDGAGACVPAPAVASTTPADGAGGVLTPTAVSVTFTAAMNPATLTGQITAGACSGSIQVSFDNFASCVPFSAAAATMSGGNTIATLTPSPAIDVGKTFKIRVTTTATSATGIAMAATYTAATGFATAALPATCTGSVVISQVYGAGGNAGASHKNDFVEIYNGGTAAVDLSTWAVHYASSTGTTWSKTNLTGSIAPGGYFLVRQAGGANGADLPTADVVGAVAMAAGAGKIVLTNTQTNIANGTICPSGATVVDIAGYGTGTNCFEGSGPTATLSATASASRKGYGCTDAGDTAADMAVGLVNPRNSQNRIAANESNLGAELDYCVLQFPPSFSVTTGMPSSTIYARIYEAGVTPGAGAGAGVSAQVGYGPVTANPQVQGGWTWVNATYNASFIDASNEEYQGSFTAPAAGAYKYTARFALNNGGWTYCDLDATLGGGDAGAGANAGLAFQTTQLGSMTVNP